jgi:hypothetical protein
VKTVAADISGQRFGKLLAVERIGTNKHKRAVWSLRCDCGAMTAAEVQPLRSGAKLSCGCHRLEVLKRGALHQHMAAAANRTHGHCSSSRHGANRLRSSEYRTWEAMRARCGNQNNNRFHIYGARGITVCTRWAQSFEAFLADMGMKPTPKHSIDRIDVDGNYETSNCRWATPAEQASNKRNSRKEQQCST